MTTDELINAALHAVGPWDEKKKAREIPTFRRTRYAEMVLVAAAEIAIEGKEHAGRTGATQTGAIDKAGIKRKQFETMASWKQQLVYDAIGHMLEQVRIERNSSAPKAPKRRGRPPKNGVAMSNAERQAAFQKRKGAAWNAIGNARGHIEQMREGLDTLELIVTDEMDAGEDKDRLMEVLDYLRAAHVGTVKALGIPDSWD